MNTEMEWGNSPPRESRDQEPPAISEIVEPGLTSAYFRSIRGTRAVFHADHAEPVVLTLASVAPLQADRDAKVVLGDSFTLIFEGDANFMLTQRMYELEFEDGFCASLFLVPVGAADGVATYESVFNRMYRPPASSQVSC